MIYILSTMRTGVLGGGPDPFFPPSDETQTHLSDHLIQKHTHTHTKTKNFVSLVILLVISGIFQKTKKFRNQKKVPEVSRIAEIGKSRGQDLGL